MRATYVPGMHTTARPTVETIDPRRARALVAAQRERNLADQRSRAIGARIQRAELQRRRLLGTATPAA